LPQRTPKREDGKELLKVPNEQDCGKEIERKGKYIKMPSDKKGKTFPPCLLRRWKKKFRLEGGNFSHHHAEKMCTQFALLEFFRGTKEFTANNLICKV
jgi:hypothetical protein